MLRHENGRYEITTNHSDAVPVNDSQYQWSRNSLDELVDFYYSETRPSVRETDYEPDNGRPSRGWLANNGSRYAFKL